MADGNSARNHESIMGAHTCRALRAEAPSSVLPLSLPTELTQSLQARKHQAPSHKSAHSRHAVESTHASGCGGMKAGWKARMLQE